MCVISENVSSSSLIEAEILANYRALQALASWYTKISVIYIQRGPINTKHTHTLTHLPIDTNVELRSKNT